MKKEKRILKGSFQLGVYVFVSVIHVLTLEGDGERKSSRLELEIGKVISKIKSGERKEDKVFCIFLVIFVWL